MWVDTVKKGRGGDTEDQQGRLRRPVGGIKGTGKRWGRQGWPLEVTERTIGWDGKDHWGRQWGQLGGEREDHWVRKRRGSLGDRTGMRGDGWALNDSVDGEETAAGLQRLLITGCCGLVWRNSSLLTPYHTPSLLTDTFRLATVWKVA